jgi:Ca2+-binding EF-hand superfamily protein
MSDKVSVLTEFFAYVDTDGDGFVTFDEIKAACEVDIDGDGTITETEREASAAAWLADFVNQDLDGDSKLTLTELLAYNA